MYHYIKQVVRATIYKQKFHRKSQNPRLSNPLQCEF